MFRREELGRRIKKVREARHMTLKAIETEAGISATHISEIERGKTSPTLGALLRIARALRTDPAYFFEAEELGAVSRVTVDDRVRVSLPNGAGSVDRLTTAIAGGVLQVCHTILAPGRARHTDAHTHGGDEAAVVLSGQVRFDVDGQTHTLGPGDAIHFHAGLQHGYTNASTHAEAVLVWVSSARGCE